MNLKDKVVVIVGATGGIGSVLAPGKSHKYNKDQESQLTLHVISPFTLIYLNRREPRFIISSNRVNINTHENLAESTDVHAGCNVRPQ